MEPKHLHSRSKTAANVDWSGFALLCVFAVAVAVALGELAIWVVPQRGPKPPTPPASAPEVPSEPIPAPQNQPPAPETLGPVLDPQPPKPTRAPLVVTQPPAPPL